MIYVYIVAFGLYSIEISYMQLGRFKSTEKSQKFFSMIRFVSEN